MSKVALLRKYLAYPWIERLLIVAIAAAVLLYASRLDLPYETDQLAKAGKILYLAHQRDFLNPVGSYEFYKDYLFSFYYIASSLLYSLFQGNIFVNTNLQTVVFGTIFLASVAEISKRVYRAKPAYTLFVFLSMPIVILTFIYSNESAFALTFFTLSLLVVLMPWRGKYGLATGLYCAAIYCRPPEYILLVPFWLFWTVSYAESYEDKWAYIKKMAYLLGLLSLFGISYWLIFLGLPNEYVLSYREAHAYETNVKLLAAFLTYPFCFSVILLGLGANFLLVYEHRKKALISLLFLLPLLFYLGYFYLASPKYLVFLSLFYGIPVSVLLTRVRWAIKVPIILSILVWWFVSISPYGIKAATGQYWVVPTADGPVPTGAYLSFYQSTHQGNTSDQVRLQEELMVGKQLLGFRDQSPNYFAVFWGNSAHSRILAYALAHDSVAKFDREAERFQYEVYRSQEDQQFFQPDATQPLLLIAKPAYLNQAPYSEKFTAEMERFLKAGQVRSLSENSEVLPALIEVGESVPKGSDLALGQRILFMRTRYKNNVPRASSEFLVFKDATCWIESGKTQPKLAPIYTDAQYSAYAVDVPGCQIFALDYPAAYYAERNPHEKVPTVYHEYSEVNLSKSAMVPSDSIW